MNAPSSSQANQDLVDRLLDEENDLAVNYQQSEQ